MKETINVNIGSRAFTLDQDAYLKLKDYLDDIKSRLPQEDLETLNDIEDRVAEIFMEQITSQMQVVGIDLVNQIIERLGSPECFGNVKYERPAPEDGKKKLYRSRQNRTLAGVCGGISAYFDLDTSLVRLLTLLLILFGGVSIWIYIILWIVLPEEPLTTRFRANN